MDTDQLVARLADGHWHHVDDAGECQIVLYENGLTAETTSDGRCRLTQPIELLDRKRIHAAINNSDHVTIEVAGTVDSTNTRLMDRPAPPPGRAEILLAEYQSAGRGRQGRSWLSPYGGGLCLSVSWQFDPLPRQPGTLSLAVGVALLRALAGFGLDEIKLKWPNDLVYDNRKLGGVLIDVTRAGQTMQIVAGIGLNLCLGRQENDQISAAGGIAAVALSDIDPALAVRRNALAASVIDSLIGCFTEFQQKGFDSFRQEYNHADLLKGCAVHVTGPANMLDGQAIGVDDDGALLVQAGQMTHRLFSGDVRVRLS